MTNSLSLITSMGREGKSPLEIAKELHARGVKNEYGKTISPDMVSGFLRFIGKPVEATESYMPAMFETISAEAVWGANRPSAGRTIVGDSRRTPLAQKEARKNRSHGGSRLSDELKAKITHLYQVEGRKVDEIAERLAVHPRKIVGFCAQLAGFSVPPGEIEIIVDSDGHKIMKCPPGYAIGAEPQRNVKPTGGGY